MILKDEIMSKIIQYIIILVFYITFNSYLLAHSDVIKTVPKNAAILDTAPQVISIYMTKKMRLVTLEVQHQDNSMIKVNNTQYKDFANQFILPIPLLKKNGIYKVNWRGIAQDGHIMKGHFNFTVTD